MELHRQDQEGRSGAQRQVVNPDKIIKMQVEADAEKAGEKGK